MRGKKDVHINISTSTVIQIVVTILLLWALFRFIYLALWPIQMFIISAFLAIALNPVVSKISGLLRRQKRVLATAVAYFFVISFIFTVMAYVLPPIYTQGQEVISNLPMSIEDLENQDTALIRFINDRGLQSLYTNLITSIQNYFSSSAETAISTVSHVGGAVVSAIAVLVMTFMMLVEGPAWINRLWNMQHGGDIVRRKRTLKRMYNMITGYVNGQLLVAGIASVVTFLVLLILSNILNVEINAFALALVVAIF